MAVLGWNQVEAEKKKKKILEEGVGGKNQEKNLFHMEENGRIHDSENPKL